MTVVMTVGSCSFSNDNSRYLERLTLPRSAAAVQSHSSVSGNALEAATEAGEFVRPTPSSVSTLPSQLFASEGLFTRSSAPL